MQIIRTPFAGLLEIIPQVYNDERGWFYEFYKRNSFQQHDIQYDFPQENMSFSKKGVIRGLHLQRPPHEQAKLVTVLQGKVLDVVVDLRKDEPTYLGVYYCRLDSEKRNMLMVPEGFAHGFAALEDSVFFYKCSHLYHKEAEAGIRYDDPDLGINWEVESPIISDKDKQLPFLQDFLRNYVI